MRDDAIITICRLTNTAEPGAMPKEVLTEVLTAYGEERAVGYNRFFAAVGANTQIDVMIRIWRHPGINTGMYAVLSQSGNDGQYRIIQAQNVLDDDGLKVCDLSLQRLEDFYDLVNG